MSALSSKKCTPCKEGTPSLKGKELIKYKEQLGGGWKVIDERHLEKEYPFKNYREAVAFTNKVAELAEQENHHPDLFLAWGKVKLQIWTHSVGGLSESDFILAAKCDVLR